MTALAADRSTQWKELGLKAYPVAAATRIYANSIVCTNASGFAVPAADAVGYTCVGMSDERVDNSAGANGDMWVLIKAPIIAKFAASSITQAMLTHTMYVVDDQTFDDAIGINGIAAGVLVEYVSTTEGWIELSPTVAPLLSGLTSSAAELNILHGVTATGVEINKLAGVVAGTSSASKAAVLGTNKNLDVLALPVGGLAIGAGAGTPITSSAAELNILTGVTATASEINQYTDESVRNEIVTATNVILANESGKTFFLNSATEFVSTLPVPALGLRFTFIVAAAPSGASYTVVTNASANIIKGNQNSVFGDAGDFGTADDTVSFVDGQSVAGDKCEFYSDGTSWFAYAISKVAAGITFTQVS